VNFTATKNIYKNGDQTKIQYSKYEQDDMHLYKNYKFICYQYYNTQLSFLGNK